MSQGNDPRGWLPTTSLLVLLAGASYLAFDRPLESSRPPRSSEIDAARQVDGRIDARLWQDPFEAAENAAGEFIKTCEANEKRAGDSLPGHACLSENHTLRFRLNEQRANAENSRRGTTLVIGAFLPTDPFSESYEQRMRERFAVSTALIRAHYRPVDSLSLSYVLDFPDGELKLGKLPRPTDVIPYDVFVADERYDLEARKADKESRERRATRQRDSANESRGGLRDSAAHDFVPGRPERVIVLWLRGFRVGADELASAKSARVEDTPLQNIFMNLRHGLFARPIRQCDWNNPNNRDCMGFALLGPTSSDELESWSKDPAFALIANDTTQFVSPDLPRETIDLLRIYVNRATARERPDELAQSDDGVERAHPEPHVLRDVSRGGIRYVMPADYQVIPHLTSELRRRLAPQSCGPLAGFAPWRWTDRKDVKRVLVVYEGDTRYARNLVTLYKDYSTKSFGREVLGHCLRVNTTYADYLQGLDGEIGQSSSKGSGSASPSALIGRAAGGPVRSALEYPAGRAQLDRVKDMIARQKRRDGSTMMEPLDAIVIFGSDVYDKLLLIQAARAVAPRALLLTTDLDSRFFDPAEYDATRNLIVVSGLGLSGDKDEDMRRPPEPITFRDAYQHSTHRAVRQAVCEFYRADALCAKDTGSPGVYEVGRTRMVAFDAKSVVESNLVEVGITSNIFAVLIIAALILASAFVGGRYLLWLASEHHLRSHLGWALGGSALYVSAYWLWFQPTPDLGGVEPFYLLEGVSIWPTQILRQLTTVLAVFFLVFMVFDIQRSNTRLERRNPDLCPAPDDKDLAPEGHLFFACLRTMWRARKPAVLFAFWKGTSINRWVQRLIEATNDSTQPLDVTLPQIWKRYRQLGHSPVRMLRVIIGFAFFVFMYLIVWMVASEDVNSVPARAGLLGISASEYWRSAFFANAIAITLCAAVALLCVSFVIDSTRLCAGFVRWWTMACTHGGRKLGPSELTRAMEVVGERTSAVGKFVVYPFCIMAVLVVSRSGYFDSWGFPASFAVIMFMVGVHAFAAAWSLRKLCERMRSELIKHVRTRMLETTGTKYEAGAWDNTLTFITEYRAGAFSEWFRNPLIRALLLPAGGAGVVTALLDVAAMS
jgi:hypothetical protein